MANRFVLNETSYHGAGAITEIATEAIGRGFKKAFVCSDPDLIKFGVTKKVTDVLDNAGLAYEIYSNIKPNPTIENVQSGVAPTKNKSVPIFAVPTTAGTAAEVTINYVITGCWNSSRLKGYRKTEGYSFPCSVCI